MQDQKLKIVIFQSLGYKTDGIRMYLVEVAERSAWRMVRRCHNLLSSETGKSVNQSGSKVWGRVDKVVECP